MYDICSPIYDPPYVEKSEIDTLKSEIIFTFNEGMLDYTFQGHEFDLSFSGPGSGYTVSWSAAYISEKKLKLMYSVSPGIVGGVSETLRVSLSDVSAFKSSHSIAITSSSEYEYIFDTIQVSASAQAAGKGASYMFVFTFALSIGANILTGGSMELMWSLTNTLQIVFI